MKRRSWLLAGAGSAALVAGLAWQRGREEQRVQGASAAAGASAPGGAPDPIAALWQMRFDQPDGGTLDMATLRGQPLLLNFWGTWCPPCVKEMPDLDRFARRFGIQGWRVVGLAVDNPKAVREFLGRTPVSYIIAMAGFEGSELSRQLGNSQGGLPYTVAFDRQGVVVHRKAGATTLEELTSWAQKS